jgi:hypothetical protein
VVDTHLSSTGLFLHKYPYAKLSPACMGLGMKMPDPASVTTEDNDYVFERAVKEYLPDGAAASRRIDLYKRAAFVLEAKQSRLKGQAKGADVPAGAVSDG